MVTDSVEAAINVCVSQAIDIHRSKTVPSEESKSRKPLAKNMPTVLTALLSIVSSKHIINSSENDSNLY